MSVYTLVGVVVGLIFGFMIGYSNGAGIKHEDIERLKKHL